MLKKYKLAFLLGIIALFCFAAAAIAAPKSLVITDMDDGTYEEAFGTSNFSQYMEISALTEIGESGSATSPRWTQGGVNEAIPSEEELMQFVPSEYTGNVSADIYYRTKLTFEKGQASEDNMPAGYYTFQAPTNGPPYCKWAVEQIKTVVVFGSDGKAELCPAIYTEVIEQWETEKRIDFELKEAKSYPVRVYGLTFSHTPLPKYTITAAAGANGTITPASADVEEGASCDFVLAADKGYVIDALTVDGSAVAAAAGVASYTYTLENVTKAVSISATFKKSIEPGKENVSEIGASGEGVTAAEPVFVEASDKIVASFDAQADNSKELPLVKADGTSDQNVTFKKEAFVCAVKLDVTHTDAAAAMTLAFSPAKDKTFDAAKKYYAMILNKKTGAYAIFECAQANGKLNMTVRPVGDYFSENTVVVYTGTATNAGGDTPSTGGGSGGGCNTGMAALALLALVPLALRRKK